MEEQAKKQEAQGQPRDCTGIQEKLYDKNRKENTVIQ